ncbi:MAG: DUF4185 domain-containing protein [Chloroflexia bacterium]|nr:DUF4185 domain-containing protein [Chloroflexia bacterium]
MKARLGLLLWIAALPMVGPLLTASATAREGTPPASPIASPVASPVAGAGSAAPVRLVAQLTGAASINETDANYGVSGTDLGHTFEHNGSLYMVFGDTFGAFKSDWRSNVAAVISDDDPSDGLTFDRMITDQPGHAKALIPQEAVEGVEVTIIPTYGVSVETATGPRMVLHYMAVQEWGEPGRWDLNHSGLAYSDDDGETWTVDPAATWPADSNFGQVAIEKVGEHAYLFGIPGGRFGGVALARVAQQDILDMGAYEYWDGQTWVRGDATAAATVVPAPAGELSVRWNEHYQTWIMMYLNEDKYAIVLRTADCLAGPWSEETTVVTGAEYAQLYSPYMPPRWNDGPEIYFSMSIFNAYQVLWMQTSLTGTSPSTAEPQCVAPE